MSLIGGISYRILHVSLEICFPELGPYIQTISRILVPQLVHWWRAIGEFDARGWLSEIKQPTLIIYGKDDDLIRTELREELISRFPHAQVVTIAGARHYPQVQFAEQVNPILFDFLGDN